MLRLLHPGLDSVHGGAHLGAGHPVNEQEENMARFKSENKKNTLLLLRDGKLSVKRDDEVFSHQESHLEVEADTFSHKLFCP